MSRFAQLRRPESLEIVRHSPVLQYYRGHWIREACGFEVTTTSYGVGGATFSRESDALDYVDDVANAAAARQAVVGQLVGHIEASQVGYIVWTEDGAGVRERRSFRAFSGFGRGRIAAAYADAKAWLAQRVPLDDVELHS